MHDTAYTPHKCYGFFDRLEALCIGLELSEIKMLSGESDVLPTQTDTHTLFTKNVALKTPIASAAMDNVTESRMAIAIAKVGGIGVIHRNLSPKDQAAEVRKVKRHLNGIIENPEVVRDHWTMKQVFDYRRERDIRFRKFPVLNDANILVGWLGRDQFDFCMDDMKKVSEIMAPIKVTAHPNTKPEVALGLMCKHGVRLLPLVTTDGRPVEMYVFSDVNRIVKEPSSAFNVDQNGRLRVAAAVGVGDDALARCAEFPDDIDVVVIDSAHANTTSVVETMRQIKLHSNAKFDLMVGNISRGDAALRLIGEGADGLKVGQGPGSICTTQNVSGVGRGQLTAVH